MSLDVRVGINPISWTNDDLPELGGETPLETALREGKEIGYQGFELGNKFPKTKEALKEKLAEFNLACVSGWYSGELVLRDLETEIEAAEGFLTKLAYNGCQVVVYGEVGRSVQGKIHTPLLERPKLADSDWADYGAKLNAFSKHMKQHHGLTLAYHHHMGAVVQSFQDIDRLMQATDPALVGLLYDSGHAYFGGIRPPDLLLEKHLNRVVHVHLKDVRKEVIEKAENLQWSFLYSVLNGVFTVPGDGAIDFEKILRLLSRRNYKGWLVVEAEQDPAIAPSYRYAKKGLTTVQNLLKEIEHG